jgi:hypothetical protein
MNLQAPQTTDKHASTYLLPGSIDITYDSSCCSPFSINFSSFSQRICSILAREQGMFLYPVTLKEEGGTEDFVTKNLAVFRFYVFFEI